MTDQAIELLFKEDPREHEMQIVYCLTESVTPTEYNPGSRTDPKNLAPLLESISKRGLYFPILVDSNRVIIDGNRRFNCLKQLDYFRVPTIEYTGDALQAFLDINSTSRPLNAKEQLDLWMKVHKVADKKMPAYQHLDKILTSDDWNEVESHRKDPANMLSIARSYIIYLGLEVNDFNDRKVLLWVIRHNASTLIRKIKAINMDKTLILSEYIDKDRALVLRN